jgi:hypothetical protein
VTKSDEPISDPRLEAYERELASVLVERSVLLEALEQIEATWVGTVDWDDYRTVCDACAAAARKTHETTSSYTAEHKPDCRYVRVRDAPRRVLG